MAEIQTMTGGDEVSSDQGEFNPWSDSEEQHVLHAALDSFRQYRTAAHYNITHLRRQSFYALPTEQMELLAAPPFSLPETFDAVDDAIDTNADLAEAILAAAIPSFGLHPTDTTWHGTATPNDMDKARSTIRQFHRDWSTGGAPERTVAHDPLFAALSTHLPTPPHKRHAHALLVPGAGLGRFVLDLCAAGYIVEGNEISLHQLFASNYALNHTTAPHQHALHPWALTFSNHKTRANQLRAVQIPDVHPASILEASQHPSLGPAPEVHYSERMAMTAGDFVTLYRQAEYAGRFAAVVCCFFLDTAPNVIEYLHTARQCLRPAGLLLNLGPLLWHFEAVESPAERERRERNEGGQGNGKGSGRSRAQGDRFDGIGAPGSFELADDEVLALLGRVGFEVVEQRASGEVCASGYIQDPESMLRSTYYPTFWVARKKEGW